MTSEEAMAASDALKEELRSRLESGIRGIETENVPKEFYALQITAALHLVALLQFALSHGETRERKESLALGQRDAFSSSVAESLERVLGE